MRDLIKLLGYCAKILNIPSNILSLSTIKNIFKITCSKGNLNVAQLLYQIKLDININANNEAFKSTYVNANLHMAKWLCQIKPKINISAENDEAFRSHVLMVI
jgi:hypothetical protein